jgi:hypothetical protein
MSEPSSPRVFTALNSIAQATLRTARQFVIDRIRAHEAAPNPHPQYRVRVREVDGIPSGLATTLIFPNGAVEFPEDTSDTAVITAGGSLTVREIDGTPTGSATILEVPNGSLTFPEETPGVARLDVAVAATLGGVSIDWPDNGTARFQAAEAMTLSLEYSSLGGGSVAWTVNGTGASPPFTLDGGDILSGVLTGSTGGGTAALKRTA